MGLRACLCLALAACNQAYGLDQTRVRDAFLPPGPIRDVVASANAVSLDLVIPQTAAGNTLLAVASIASTGTHIDLTDDGGNTWVRGVDGPVAIAGASTRFEIWYVLDARAITRATATVASAPMSKALSIHLMEWEGLVRSGTIITSVGPSELTATAATVIETTLPALVVGAGACLGTAPAELITKEFTPSTFLLAFAGTSSGCNVAYANRLVAGPQEIAWTLPDPAVCSAGAIAFPLAAPPD